MPYASIGSHIYLSQCGAQRVVLQIQPLEALLFTLDEINADEKILPGIKLGMNQMDRDFEEEAQRSAMYRQWIAPSCTAS